MNKGEYMFWVACFIGLGLGFALVLGALVSPRKRDYKGDEEE